MSAAVLESAIQSFKPAGRWINRGIEMEFRSFAVNGPLEIVPRKIEDERGYFSELYRADRFCARAGSVSFVQENQSLSVRPGTIRGIHFQTHPCAQGKLVRCVSGSVLDIAVDLRISRNACDAVFHARFTVLSPKMPVGRTMMITVKTTKVTSSE